MGVGRKKRERKIEAEPGHQSYIPRGSTNDGKQHCGVMSFALGWSPSVVYIPNALTLNCSSYLCKVWPCPSRTTNTEPYSEHTNISHSMTSIPSEGMLHLEINSLCLLNIPLLYGDLAF